MPEDESAQRSSGEKLPKQPAGHYVPQLLLREFGVETMRATSTSGRFGRKPGHVWQANKLTGAIERVSIRQAAQRPGYYLLEGIDRDYENALGGIEQASATVLRYLLDLPDGHHILPPDYRTVWSVFIATSLVRTPAHLDPQADLEATFALATIDMVAGDSDRFRADARARGRKETDEWLEAERQGIVDDIRSGRIGIDASDSSKATSLRVAIRHLVPIIAAMSWVVLRVPTGPWFVLGDLPVVVATEDRRPSGLRVEGSALTAPMAPTALFIAAGTVAHRAGVTVVTDGPEHTRHMEMATAADANLRTWSLAREFIYGHSRDHLEEVRLAMGADASRRPVMKVSGLPAQWRSFLGDEIQAVDDLDLPDDLIRWWID